MAGMTTRELLEKLYNQDYEKLKGKKLRMTRVRVPGKEVCLAHVSILHRAVFIRILVCILESMREKTTQEKQLE